jgi:uncharacterized protein YbcI
LNEQGTLPQTEDDSAASTMRAELSREMVRPYKELFGRGPTKARTDFASPDTILCTLEHSLTPAERALVELGEHQRLRARGCTSSTQPRTASARSWNA